MKLHRELIYSTVNFDGDRGVWRHKGWLRNWLGVSDRSKRPLKGCGRAD